MKKEHYWTGRPEKIIEHRYGSYILSIRHLANCNKAQVTMKNISLFRFPLLWSTLLTDQQANAAGTLFDSIGYFDMPQEVNT